jgi:hypothetical protein
MSSSSRTGLVASLLACCACTAPNPYYREPGDAEEEFSPEGDIPIDDGAEVPLDADADADVVPDGDGDAAPDADAEAWPDADGDADAEAGEEGEAEGEAEAGFEAEVDVEPDREEGGEAGPEGEVVEEDGAVDADGEPEADGEAEAEVGDEAGAPDEADVEIAPADRDGDGVADDLDRCPDVWNPDQEDCDGDTVGDRCETGDTDADTLPDAIDVCACGPAGGTHDEDSDTIPDDCDNCPLAGNATQANADLDGLGDACEPPTAPELLLRIDRFEPFLAVPSDPGWYVSSGTWVLGADVYNQTSDATSATAFYDGWDRGADLFVQGVFRINALGPGGTGISKQVAVLARAVRLLGGEVRWYSCGLDASHDRVEIRMWDGVGYSTLAQAGATVPVDPGVMTYRVSFLVQGPDLSCSIEAPVAAPVTVTATDIGLLVGAPGLRTYRTTASFSGLMVAR